MKSQLRVLHLEDSAHDAELVRMRLEEEGFHCDTVLARGRAAFEAAVAHGPFDLILSDFALPDFDGLTALSLAREKQPHVPFILLSGTLGEDQAVDSLKSGATDYILKDRLARLVPAVRRALQEARKKTELDRAEEAMSESESKYRHLFESLSDAAFLGDEETNRILDTNRQAERLLGKKRAEILGHRLASVHPQAKVEESARRMAGCRGFDEPISYEAEITRGDGGIVPVHISAAPVTFHERRLILALYRDISEKKQLEAQFLRAQRLESVGALASGIAHDLNNILAPIMMSAPMLRWGLKPAEFEKTLASIESSAQRGAELVKQLLTFGRGVEGKRTFIQPKHLAKEMVKMVRETFPKAIAVKSRLSAELWFIEADATQLHQVLLNLCVNARDAMPAGGTLSVSAENVSLDDHYASMIPEAKAGPYVVLQVADTGQGILPEIMDRIFDPFFTTKEPGKGTGLGLSTVLGIVKGHGGFLDVKSEVGKGSTFTVYLPATPEKRAPTFEAGTVSTTPGQGELILVVDDEPQILAVTQTTLEKNGYKVFVAEDGVSALVLFTKHQDEVKAVVTDLDMPFMDGVALVRALKKMDSAVKAIACTGIGSAESLHDKTTALRELGVQTFLSKPYAAPTLLNALQEVLREE